MNRPEAERGPKLTSEITQPQRMMISGVRQLAFAEAPGAIAFSDIAPAPDAAVEAAAEPEHRQTGGPSLTNVGDAPHPFRSWLRGLARLAGDFDGQAIRRV